MYHRYHTSTAFSDLYGRDGRGFMRVRLACGPWRTTRTSTRASRSSSALFGGEYQEGVLTAYCSIEDVPHVELNGHILVPLQNVASLHCSSRCDAPEPAWPPRGLEELDRDDRPDADADEEEEG